MLNIDIMSLIQLAVLAIVALVLGLGVVRPILSKTPEAVPALGPPPRQGLPGAAPFDSAGGGLAPIAAGAGAAAPGLPALSGEIDDGSNPIPQMAVVSGDGLMAAAGLGGGEPIEDPVERLRSLIDERKDETIEVLRAWMEEDEETV